MTESERLNDVWPGDPFSEWVGVEHDITNPGQVRVRLTVRPEHRNAFGRVHGAVLYTAADTAMGRALVTLLDTSEVCWTVSVLMNYLAPVTGHTVEAEANVLDHSTRLATVQTEVRDQDTLCAVATGTFYIAERRT